MIISMKAMNGDCRPKNRIAHENRLPNRIVIKPVKVDTVKIKTSNDLRFTVYIGPETKDIHASIYIPKDYEDEDRLGRGIGHAKSVEKLKKDIEKMNYIITHVEEF